MHTNATILDRFQVTNDGIEHLDMEVPVLSASQRQGDVLLLKVTTDRTKGATPVDAKGVTVVRGETSGGNAHILHALTGDVLWLPNARAGQADDLMQGWLTVSTGAEATLIHTEEHSAIGIGPGTYEVRRQREFAGEWALVAD